MFLIDGHYMMLRELKCESRGGTGGGGPDPPGKSQVIWDSIGNKQSDPLEKVGPPWNMLDPSGTLKIIVYFEIILLTSVK